MDSPKLTKTKLNNLPLFGGEGFVFLSFYFCFRQHPTMNVSVNNDFFCPVWIKAHNESSIFALKNTNILPNYFSLPPS